MMLSILTPPALRARLTDVAAASICDMAPRVWRANGMQEDASRIIADRLMVERLVPIDDDWLRRMVLGDSPATELDWSTVDGALALIGEFDEASLHRVTSTVCGIASGKPSSAVMSGGASNMAALERQLNRPRVS